MRFTDWLPGTALPWGRARPLKSLLAFGRKQVLQPRVIDLNAVITDLSKMLRRLIGEDLELIMVLAPEAGQVNADPGQIEQAVVNLVVNARDAMPHGGKIVIETAQVELDESYAGKHIAVLRGEYVMLAVSDSGTGMDAETQKHMFEPFFTTKELGKGTGLGLATVYGIVKQSGGNIWVYSELGVGATFKIYLPRIEKAVETVKLAAPSTELLEGTETILLAEDDPMVRILVRDLLLEHGYQVLAAADGDEALMLCERHGGAIDLMVTDLVMPRMSGRELAKRLDQLRPEVKVLYMSGYTDGAIVHHGVLDAGVAFLNKPFTPDVLLRKVREVLSPPSAD